MSSRPATVMVVDDDETLGRSLQAIATRRGYSPVLLADPDEAVRRFREDPPAAVVLDAMLPGGRALDALALFKRIDHEVPVLVVSGRGEPSTVVQAMAMGAADFLCKPVEEDLLDATLRRLLAERRLSAELASLRRVMQSEPPYRLVAADAGAMAGVAQLILRVADTDAAVLLRGEPGTGKERVARAIHAASARSRGPFVKVACGAQSPAQLESALFGSDPRVSGGLQHRPGRLEFASHGTAFFDEVGALDLTLQGRLLHVLREGHFSRSAVAPPVQVDARIVAATSDDLERAAAEGRFREELLFRLNVVEIVLPPLRERPEDIGPLTDHFLATFSLLYNTPPVRLSSETRRLFEEHSWPGNVRELESAVRRLVVLGSEVQVRRDVLRTRGERPAGPAPLGATPAGAATAVPPTLAAALPAQPAAPAGSLKDIARAAAREAERAAISRMLQRTHWNRKEAAEILGISYKALLYKIKENGLDKPSTS